MVNTTKTQVKYYDRKLVKSYYYYFDLYTIYHDLQPWSQKASRY